MIRSEEKRLWERRAPARAVSIGSVRVAESEDGKIEVSWKATWPRGAERNAWVRYSADKGRTWKSIVTDATADSVIIDSGHLPIGKILIEVIAHDGFHSARSKPVEFANVERLPEPVILHPNPKGRLVAGMTLGLLASVALQKGHETDRLEYHWAIDGKDAGEGLQVFDVVPAPGRHRLVFTVSDRKARKSRQAQIEFTSVEGRTPVRG